MSGRSGLLVALGLTLVGLTACGTKGDPVPPPPADERQEAEQTMPIEPAD